MADKCACLHTKIVRAVPKKTSWTTVTAALTSTGFLKASNASPRSSATLSSLMANHAKLTFSARVQAVRIRHVSEAHLFRECSRKKVIMWLSQQEKTIMKRYKEKERLPLSITALL